MDSQPPAGSARRRFGASIAAAVLAAALAAGCSQSGTNGPAATVHKPVPVSYYLALGDSLSQGVQPNASGASVETSHGYADQLYAMLLPRHPGLRLVKLGCTGETTNTMIRGGPCHYAAGSQLAAATAFLRAHRSTVLLVTLDIGANDPASCMRTSFAGMPSCLGQRLQHMAANLDQIVAGLRTADPRVRMIAMNYYLPALSAWRTGFVGHGVARVAELAAEAYNAMLVGTYQASGVRVADVFDAFRTGDFSGSVTVPGLGTMPQNVAAICEWTWECAAAPRGPNEHANRAGYGVIARTFLGAIGGLWHGRGGSAA